MALGVKNLSPSAGDIGDAGSIPGSGRSPGGEHGNPRQYSCLGNPMNTGAWWATIHRVTKSWTRCSDLARAHVLRSASSAFVFLALNIISLSSLPLPGGKNLLESGSHFLPFFEVEP